MCLPLFFLQQTESFSGVNMDRYTYDPEKDLKVLGCAADYLTFGHVSTKFGTLRSVILPFHTLFS